MHRYLSTGHMCSKMHTVFQEKLKQNSKLRGTDCVIGQISALVFELNEGFCSYYPSNTFAMHRKECLQKAYCLLHRMCTFHMMDYNFFILISYLIDIANILKGEILSCSLMRDYSMGSMHKRFFSTTCYASKKWTSECSEQVCFLMHGNKWIKIVQALSTVWYLCVWPSHLVDKYIVYLYYCFFYHLYLPSTLWKFVFSHHEGCLFLKSR